MPRDQSQQVRNKRPHCEDLLSNNLNVSSQTHIGEIKHFLHLVRAFGQSGSSSNALSGYFLEPFKSGILVTCLVLMLTL